MNKYTIPFNKPPYTGVENEYVTACIGAEKISGDGYFGKLCQEWFNDYYGAKCLLVSSGTHALEIAAIVIDIQPGDEVIMPSYTFVSTANAFALRGAKIIFVDIDPDTLNLNLDLVAKAISARTKAIVPVHYAGISCNLDRLMEIASANNIYVIEDAAQGIFAAFRSKPLGSYGHISALSFHETKNITSGGEGGLVIINDPKLLERAEIVREKGTNRSKFFRGQVDKYSWVDIGSSYLASELQAAYLWGQLQSKDLIQSQRMTSWNLYKNLLSEKVIKLKNLPQIPSYNDHNGHIFYIKASNLEERTCLLDFLNSRGVGAVFHYVPLHSSAAGQKYGILFGEDKYTTNESEKIIRLPLFYGIKEDEIRYIVDQIKKFYGT